MIKWVRAKQGESLESAKLGNKPARLGILNKSVWLESLKRKFEFTEEQDTSFLKKYRPTSCKRPFIRYRQSTQYFQGNKK